MKAETKAEIFCPTLNNVLTQQDRIRLEQEHMKCVNMR